MDDTDQRLLAAITENARTPIKQVAEEAGVSREVADYRLKKLEEEVIRGYQARLNLSKFTKSSHTMFLQLKRWDGREEQHHILDFLRETYPHWIGRASGYWDVLFFFSIPEDKSLNEVQNKIYDYFGENLKRHKTLTVTEEHKDTYQGLFGESGDVTNHEEFTGEIDDKDKEILQILSRNARTSNKEIGEEVGLSSEAVRYRIDKLEEDNIILNYRVVYNLEALDRRAYAVSLNTTGVTSDEESEVNESLSEMLDTTFVGRTTGEHTSFAILTAEELESFEKKLRKVRDGFGDHLLDFEVSPLLDFIPERGLNIL